MAGAAASLFGVAIVLVAVTLVRTQLFIVRVAGTSMEPTLVSGEAVLAVRSWPSNWLRPGTIVLIRGYGGVPLDSSAAAQADALLIKRVTHVGGQTVCLRAEEMIQTVECSKSWTSRLLLNELDLARTLILKTREVFVMADRREDGFDSRCFGPVAVDAIAGIAIRKLTSRSIRPIHSGSDARGQPTGASH